MIRRPVYDDEPDDGYGWDMPDRDVPYDAEDWEADDRDYDRLENSRPEWRVK